MKNAVQKDYDRILAYLKLDVCDCLYMYIDIAKYGLDNPNIKVWIDETSTGDIKTVVMKYYDSISVYSGHDTLDLDSILKIIKEYSVSTINGKKQIIEAIMPCCEDDYDAEYGYVFKFNSIEERKFDFEILTADKNDMIEIAELICKDEEFGQMYDPDVLASQLTERLETNMGRSYIVKHGDRIIGHIASYAEFENLSTTSGLVVDKEYQNGIMGTILEEYLVCRLQEDGFDVYTFVTKELRRRLLNIQGHNCISEYGKMVKLT